MWKKITPTDHISAYIIKEVYLKTVFLPGENLRCHGLARPQNSIGRCILIIHNHKLLRQPQISYLHFRVMQKDVSTFDIPMSYLFRMQFLN